MVKGCLRETCFKRFANCSDALNLWFYFQSLFLLSYFSSEIYWLRGKCNTFDACSYCINTTFIGAHSSIKYFLAFQSTCESFYFRHNEPFMLFSSNPPFSNSLRRLPRLTGVSRRRCFRTFLSPLLEQACATDQCLRHERPRDDSTSLVTC